MARPTRSEIRSAINQSQGGTKVLVVAPDDNLFQKFKQLQPQSARFMFRCENAEEIRRFPRAEVMCVGPFWCHPYWDAIYEMIQREKSRLHPNIVIYWFPMSPDGGSISNTPTIISPN